MDRVRSQGWAETLERLPAAVIWLALAIIAGGLHVADRAAPSVGLGPLYIPLIALAAWRLGYRPGLIVLAAAVALNASSMIKDGDAGTTVILLARGIVRLSTYAFTIAMVRFARREYDLQHNRAGTDGMTGAANRQCFDRELERVLGRARQNGLTILLAMFDVDDFKAINDTYGHQAGDSLLKAIADNASAQLRTGDGFGRIGGDEFALFLVVRSPAEAQTLSLALHRRLQRAIREHRTPATISMGVVVVPPHGSHERATLLRKADEMLYAAKRGGKARVATVVLEEAPVTVPAPPAAEPISPLKLPVTLYTLPLGFALGMNGMKTVRATKVRFPECSERR